MSAPGDRRVFAPKPLLVARVKPEGFEILQTEERVDLLEGHVTSHRSQRKLFLEGILACRSDDAVVGSDGKTCDVCRHPLCRPQIRMRLADRDATYVIDLAVSSARNLLDVEEALRAKGLRLVDQRLRLTVIHRGYYGEVKFERLE